MNRQAVLNWFKIHPRALEGAPEEMVSRCERAVRRHAREDAWVAAKAYVEQRRKTWVLGEGGHASEVYVARQICREVAEGLSRREPTVGKDDADHLAGGPVRSAVDEEGWRVLVGWIVDLALEEERETWQEIVHYTDRHAPELIRKHGLSEDCSLSGTRCFGETAWDIAGLLERDYSLRAFPH